ncbi:hypothetical protein ACFLV7_00920 [Chloroflexota bacterium]
MDRAIYRGIPVEVLRIYESGDNKYAAVRAIEGKPFYQWRPIPVPTEYETVKLEELSEITTDPKSVSNHFSLLSMALAYKDKKQWYSGESVWLWRNGSRGAFLKEEQGFINLNLVGEHKSVTIFWLNPNKWEWEISRNVGIEYHKWADCISGKV